MRPFAVYGGAGFSRLPLVVAVCVFLVTLPFVLAFALIAGAARRFQPRPRIRVSPRRLDVGRDEYPCPTDFAVEGLYGGGGRVIAEFEDGAQLELPTAPLSFADADELARELREQSTEKQEEGRYR